MRIPNSVICFVASMLGLSGGLVMNLGGTVATIAGWVLVAAALALLLVIVTPWITQLLTHNASAVEHPTAQPTVSRSHH